MPKALVIQVVGRENLPATNQKWEKIPALETFTQGIQTSTLKKGEDVSPFISGVPTVFARENLFVHSLSFINDIRKNKDVGINAFYAQLVDEWRGLIACIALDSNKLQAKKIELAYSDGAGIRETENVYEPKGAFGNMLMDDKELWSDQNIAVNETPVPYIYVIKYDGKIVGGTSPRSLLFTSVSYSMEGDKVYIDPTTGKFTDPLNSGIEGSQLLELFAYVNQLVPKVDALQANFKDKVKYTSIRAELVEWRDQLKAKIPPQQLEKANAQSVSIFGAPFSIAFNYTNNLYGYNGEITSQYQEGAFEFRAEDLLLPRNSKIARFTLAPDFAGNPEKLSELPVYLLKARHTGKSVYSFFAIPLSESGLNVFGKNIGVLLGIDKGGDLKSRIEAEYDEATASLTVELILIMSDSGKQKRIPVTYQVQGVVSRQKDIVIWPNFISRQWNRYFMYSELPHGCTPSPDCPFKAVPFVGDKDDKSGIFPIIMKKKNTPDDKDSILYIAENNNAISQDGQVNTELHVLTDRRTQTEPYRYEIYESNQPFKGVKLTAADKDSGYVMIHYGNSNQDRQPVNKLDEGLHDVTPVTLGIDFGSTNTSIAYCEGQGNAKGMEFRDQRISLFLNNHNAKGMVPMTEKNLLFFQSNTTASNAIKSILAVHDDKHLPNSDRYEHILSEPVKGGFPCFSHDLMVENVQENRISVGFPNGSLVNLVHNMKWSDNEMDKARKKAFLSSLMLHVYATLFDMGNSGHLLAPQSVNWSYPSAMSDVLKYQYADIWRDVASMKSPVVGRDNNEIKFQIAQAPTDEVISSTDDGWGNAAGGSGWGSGDQTANNDAGWGAPQQNNNDAGWGAPQQQNNAGGWGAPQQQNNAGGWGAPQQQNNAASGWGGGWGGQQQAAPQQNLPNLVPDNGPVEFHFKPIDQTKALTEACAVANYLSRDSSLATNDMRVLTLCFDIGGSTTDISALCSEAGNSYMIKQSSIHFAAQRVGGATGYVYQKFEKVMEDICHRHNIRIVGFNVGRKTYNQQTASYYFEQIVDKLEDSQLKDFYSKLATDCPELFCVDLYVTGLIFFYAGQLTSKLIKEVQRSNDLPSKTNWHPLVQVVFAGKGARIVEWLTEMDNSRAQQYYQTMYINGMGGMNVAQSILGAPPRINPSHKQGAEVKYEVSMGLAGANRASTPIQVTDEAIEILGETGFTLTNPKTGEMAELSFDNSVTPEMMEWIGQYLQAPLTGSFNPMQTCFFQFIKVFYDYATRLFNLQMKQGDIMNAISNMNIAAYIQNRPEFRKAKDNKVDTGKFDYVAPVILLEGMKFYDEFLIRAIQ